MVLRLLDQEVAQELLDPEVVQELQDRDHVLLQDHVQTQRHQIVVVQVLVRQNHHLDRKLEVLQVGQVLEVDPINFYVFFFK